MSADSSFPAVASVTLKLVPPFCDAGLKLNENSVPVAVGEVAFTIFRYAAPGVRIQSNGLLLGEPEGYEHTLRNLGAIEVLIALRSTPHAAITSAPSAPIPGNASVVVLTTSQNVFFLSILTTV